MSLNPYLDFDGNCREAFEFYRSVFGGEYAIFQTFADGPDDMPPMPDEVKQQVMHVSLPVGESVLMGSDSPPWGDGPPLVGSNFSITYSAESREQADEVFGKLLEGGTVSMPLADMFWGAYFGTGTDRFGISWQVNHQMAPPPGG